MFVISERRQIREGESDGFTCATSVYVDVYMNVAVLVCENTLVNLYSYAFYRVRI